MCNGNKLLVKSDYSNVIIIIMKNCNIIIKSLLA